jgi:membrane protease YdiL (CAAX protease family)
LKVDSLQLSGQPFAVCLRAVWLALLVNITTAASEEVLYRGFLVTGLKETWDASGALLVSAIIYAGAYALSANTQQTNWLHLLPMLILPGLMLAWAYLRTGNLWLVAGLHFTWNLFQNNIFNLTAQAGSDSLIGAVTSLNGPKWFVGTSLGIEMGAAGVIALSIATVCIWLYTRQRKGAAK